MTNDTQSLANTQVASIDIDWKLRRLLRTTKPDNRSLASARARTGKNYAELQMGNYRRSLLSYRKILIKAKEVGPCSLRMLERKARACLRTVREALKFTYEEIMLLLREAFLSVNPIQGTYRGAGGDVHPLGSPKTPFFASLLSPNHPFWIRGTPKTAIAAREVDRQVREREALRSRLEKDRSFAERTNCDYTNKETGEVFPMLDEGRSMIWTPTPGSPKPPGNPFLKKRSENKTPTPAARVEPQSYPQQPPEIYVPCPEEIKDQIKELAQKFNMDRITRDAKFARVSRNANLTHMERLNVEQSANEDWFRRNNRLVNSILLNRGSI